METVWNAAVYFPNCVNNGFPDQIGIRNESELYCLFSYFPLQNLFGNKSTGFGTTTTASSGFGTSSSLFGNTAAKPTTSLFGGTGTGFGQTNAGK